MESDCAGRECILGCSKLRQRTKAFRKLILSVMEHGLYQVDRGGIWCCSHTNHYKLTHTVSRCIPTHISLISHASLVLMQLPDDTMRASTEDEDPLVLQIQSVISKLIHSVRYFKIKKENMLRNLMNV
jgi:hypothetical protein